jgi:hypothetical protein
MRRGHSKESFKLRLLAVVLALILIWYSLNPSPNRVSGHKPEVNPPDEQRCDVEPQLHKAEVVRAVERLDRESAVWSAAAEEAEDWEWPEYIDG